MYFLPSLCIHYNICTLYLFCYIFTYVFVSKMRSLQHRGDDAFDAKQFQRAIQYYSDALDLDERNAEILGSRAAAYMEVGDGLLALRDAKRLSALKPTNPQASINMYMYFCLIY